MSNFEEKHIQTFYMDGMHVLYAYKFPHKNTIVFLHDSLGCIKLWRNFPFELGEKLQMNVLIYDRIGYGMSQPLKTSHRNTDYLEIEADKLKILMDTLRINSPVLFGHSDGGSIALIYGYKYTQNIQAIICEAGHIMAEKETLQGIEKAIEEYNSTPLPLKLKKYHGEKVKSLFDAWTQTWLRPEFSEWSIEENLKGITCPVLFIQGSEDEYGTDEQVFKTIKNVSGPSESFIIPNVGHTAHKEVPEMVIGKCLEFSEKYEINFDLA